MDCMDGSAAKFCCAMKNTLAEEYLEWIFSKMASTLFDWLIPESEDTVMSTCSSDGV